MEKRRRIAFVGVSPEGMEEALERGLSGISGKVEVVVESKLHGKRVDKSRFDVDWVVEEDGGVGSGVDECVGPFVANLWDFSQRGAKTTKVYGRIEPRRHVARHGRILRCGSWEGRCVTVLGDSVGVVNVEDMLLRDGVAHCLRKNRRFSVEAVEGFCMFAHAKFRSVPLRLLGSGGRWEGTDVFRSCVLAEEGGEDEDIRTICRVVADLVPESQLGERAFVAGVASYGSRFEQGMVMLSVPLATLAETTLLCDDGASGRAPLFSDQYPSSSLLVNIDYDRVTDCTPHAGFDPNLFPHVGLSPISSTPPSPNHEMPAILLPQSLLIRPSATRAKRAKTDTIQAPLAMRLFGISQDGRALYVPISQTDTVAQWECLLVDTNATVKGDPLTPKIHSLIHKKSTAPVLASLGKRPRT